MPPIGIKLFKKKKKTTLSEVRVGSGGGQWGGMCPPHTFGGGGKDMFVFSRYVFNINFIYLFATLLHFHWY